MNQTKLITINGAINEYGIPRKTIEVAIQERRLNAYRLQKKTFYLRRDDFEKWIESRLSNVPLFRSKNFIAKKEMELNTPSQKINSAVGFPQRFTTAVENV